MNVSPFEAYKKYLALKLHFTSKSYDYFKFNGAVKADQASFQRRNDKYWFTKISKNFSPEELQNYLVANFVEDDKLWIGILADEQGKKNYLTWLKRVEALQYNFKEDIRNIKESEDFVDFNSLFQSKNGQYPIILQMAMSKTISLETFVILNILLDFFGRFDKIISDKLIWPEFKSKCLKYQPFIAKKIAKSDYKQILVGEFAPAK